MCVCVYTFCCCYVVVSWTFLSSLSYPKQRASKRHRTRVSRITAQSSDRTCLFLWLMMNTPIYLPYWFSGTTSFDVLRPITLKFVTLEEHLMIGTWYTSPPCGIIKSEEYVGDSIKSLLFILEIYSKEWTIWNVYSWSQGKAIPCLLFHMYKSGCTTGKSGQKCRMRRTYRVLYTCNRLCFISSIRLWQITLKLDCLFDISDVCYFHWTTTSNPAYTFSLSFSILLLLPLGSVSFPFEKV